MTHTLGPAQLLMLREMVTEVSVFRDSEDKKNSYSLDLKRLADAYITLPLSEFPCV